MRALLEHSRQTYGILPAELRRIRSRTSSRPTPYPQPQRAVKISLSPSTVRPDVPTTTQTSAVPAPSVAPVLIPQALQQHPLNLNTVVAEESPLVPRKNAKVDSGSLSQSRIGLDARGNMPGRTKRGVGKKNKENITSPGAMTA
jgi:serine/arginine repetitive matrix protein 2